jgi:hypothetical protein
VCETLLNNFFLLSPTNKRKAIAMLTPTITTKQQLYLSLLKFPVGPVEEKEQQ